MVSQPRAAKIRGARLRKALAVLRDQINSGLKEAMKAKDPRRVSTLRLISAAFKNADIEARGAGKALSDDDLLGVLQKMIKQRQESVELYEKGGRAELAQQEREEIAIVGSFLPKQLSEAEIGETVGALVKELGAQGLKDMGRVMAAMKERFAGKMDFGKASARLKALLSGPQA